jgi:hypothetical protein
MCFVVTFDDPDDDGVGGFGLRSLQLPLFAASRGHRPRRETRGSRLLSLTKKRGNLDSGTTVALP